MLSCNETNRNICLIETKANATNAAYSCWELGYWSLSSSCSCKISSGGCLNIPSGSLLLKPWIWAAFICVWKLCSIGECCQYTDKAVIFESLISHGEWATASHSKMGRPELLSAWGSFWPRARTAVLAANLCTVTDHGAHFCRLQHGLCLGLATAKHSALTAEPP